MGKTAIIFAGQGAQYPGMCEGIADCSPSAKKIFDAAERIFPNITDLIAHGPKERLDLTENTQPAVFTSDLACACAVSEAGTIAEAGTVAEAGIKVDMTAGFSLGELAACAFSGIFELSDAFELVRERASLMAKCAAAHKGAMAAVLKLDEDSVVALTKRYKELWPVNFNAPGQIAVAGDEDELIRFSDDVKVAGGKAVKLSVSGAFHSPYMAKASEGLANYLSHVEIKSPRIPVYGNFRGAKYESIADELAAQASNPVRWIDCVKAMSDDGADTFIEVGPGKTLSGLVRRILPSAKIFSVSSAAELKSTVEELTANK